MVLPPKAGNYAQIFATKGKVVYRRTPRTGSGDKKAALIFFDLEDRDEKTVLEDVDGVEVTADGKKAHGPPRRQVRDRRAQERGEVREAAPHRRDGDDGRSARGVASDVRRRLSLRARLTSTTRTCTGSTGRPTRDRYAALLDDRGHPLGRELRARRVHRRAECVAHLPRRRRSGRGARARRRHARHRLGDWRTAPTGSSESSPAARGTPMPGHRSQSPARTSRSATTSSP